MERNQISNEIFALIIDWDLFANPRGRRIEVIASDYSVHPSQVLDLRRLFTAMKMAGEIIWFEFGGNFYVDLDGPTTHALLKFLKTPEKASIIGSSFAVTNVLLQLGFKYKMDDLMKAAGEVFIERIDGNEWKDQEKLWELHAWIVSKTNQTNGEIPPLLMPLKGSITKFFRKNLSNTRNQRIRSPAAGQNVFQSFWIMNANYML
ncbi:unnamed protein product [Orchesella dallaii]|uniref:Uncharacterized protein n=1 Tax=Orchesella dallaii TaxID=48710 RepID=A0ABP1Q3S7_9HEXA